MHRAVNRSVPLACLAPVALLAAGGACVYEPTQITIVVDSDLGARPGLTLRAIVRRGAVSILGDAEADFVRPGDGGAALDGGLPEPASFTVVPLSGGPNDELVTVQVELSAPDLLVRQTQRVRFVPRHTVVVRMFLTALCAMNDRMCGLHPCTRQAYCESLGQTCGPQALCVPVEPSGATSDIGPRTDAVASDIATDTRCAPSSCGHGETACTCPGVCPAANGDGCCTPGMNNCGDSDCPVANGDGCCSPGHNNCNDSDCPVAGGDGCCSPGQNNCGDPDCPVANGDGCCSPGHNNCSDSDCAVANGDGCCSPGHNNCSDSDCPVAGNDGCCTAAFENRCIEGACPICNHNAVCETPCGEYWDSCGEDCNCEARCCPEPGIPDGRIVGHYRADWTECYNSRTTVCGAAGTLRLRWRGTTMFTRTLACP